MMHDHHEIYMRILFVIHVHWRYPKKIISPSDKVLYHTEISWIIFIQSRFVKLFTNESLICDMRRVYCGVHASLVTIKVVPDGTPL